MGSRGRSIRLRIYFLVAIPLVAMIGLLAYVAGTSVNNAVNLDRAPDLINATSLPTADFIRFVQDERAAAVVYLFRPTQANLAAYDTAVKATNGDEPGFLAAMNSAGTKNSETPAEAQGIAAVISGLSQLNTLRAGVEHRALSPLQALQDYSAGILNEPRLFLDEANSVNNATAAGQALGLIATVSAREALSQEYALLSGVLAGHRESQADRAAFAEMAATRQGDVVDADSVLDPANLAIFNAQVNSAYQTDVTDVEEAVSAGTPLAQLPVTLTQWQGLAGQLLGEYFTGGVNVEYAGSYTGSGAGNVVLGSGPPDQPDGLDPGRRHGRHRPARAAGHDHGDHPGRAQHHPAPARAGAQRAPAGRGPAAGRGGPAAAR